MTAINRIQIRYFGGYALFVVAYFIRAFLHQMLVLFKAKGKTTQYSAIEPIWNF